jgi:TonB family protein
MRKLAFSTFTCLILFSLAVELHITAQQRRKTQSDVNQVRAPDVPPVSEERRKLFEACSTPDRPKPPVEMEIKAGVLCGKAINLPKPPYPEEAKAKGISGIVTISVVTDEDGYVIWAEAVEGHPLLQPAAVNAACQARYSPEKISNRPIKVSRVITYNFINE